MLAFRYGLRTAPGLTRSTGRPRSPSSAFLQSEMRPERQRVGMCAIEFDQKIDVASLRVEIAACGRTEKIEPTHVEAAAYRPQFLATQRDLVDHHCSGSSMPLAATCCMS